jgi:hypothetical protein
VQIGRLPARSPVPDDLPGALAARATSLGHRPAVTVRRAGRREEQGFSGLAQWAAKGAHLLTLDLLLEPGDRVAIVGPPGWMPVAVAHAAWWAGLVVTDGPADVAIVHVDAAEGVSADDVLVWGDAVDGTPDDDVGLEPWAVAVQAFPDQPPTPRGTAEAPAVLLGERARSGAEVLAEARELGGDGALGVEAGSAPRLADWLVAVAVRPLATGRPTVVVDGVGRDDVADEAVDAWLG